MTKAFALTLLLGIWIASPAFAGIFKCQQPNGTIVFTDRPSVADCKLERVQDLPPLGVIADMPASRGSDQSAAVAPAQSGGHAAKSYDEFKSDASLLVKQFTDARRRAMRGIVVNKLEARRDLAEIRAHKATLSVEIQKSSLGSSEKLELAGILASITE